MSFEEKEMKAVEMSLDAEPLKAANDQLNVSGLVLLRGLCLTVTQQLSRARTLFKKD